MEEKLAELHERLLAAQVKKAELELARTEEEVRSWEAQRETRKRQNQQALNDLIAHMTVFLPYGFQRCIVIAVYNGIV